MADPTSPTVAVIGLGNMGSEIARRLATRFEVIGYDANPGPGARLAVSSPVRVAGGLGELAAAGFAVLSLPTRQASVSVVTELAPVLKPGSVVVETSTVNPSDVARLSELCQAAGLEIVDAAILAGVAQMRLGQAAVMASGADAAVARVAPLIETMSEQWTNVGALGNAMALKVIHNAVIHGVMVVLAEALALAKTTGADPEMLVSILKDPDRGLLRPLTHRVAERMLTGSYEGGMPTEAALKDSVLALELSQQGHVPMFAMQSSHAVYEAAVAMGLGRLDYAAIARLWEQWGGYSFAATPGPDEPPAASG